MTPKPISILFVNVGEDETSPSHQLFVPPLIDGDRSAFCSGFPLPPNLPLPPQTPTYTGNGTFVSFFKSFHKSIVSNRYDIVQLHSTHASLIYALHQVYRPTKRLPPAILTIHTSYQNLSKSHIVQLIISIPFLKRVVFCGNASRSSFPPWLLDMIGAKQHVIVNGCDIANIEAADNDAAKKPDEFRVISACRFIKIKRIPDIIQGFIQADLPSNSKLILLGDGPEFKNISESVANCTHNNQIELKGKMPRQNVYREMKESHLFISLSSVEGLPKTAIEAMTCGLPVILSDIPPHREIANNTPGVMLINALDTQAVQKAISDVNKWPPKYRMLVGQKNREFALKNFSSARMRSEYRKIYEETRP